MRLAQLLEIPVLQRLTEANWKASGMPIGIVDARDGSVLIGVGWQEICTHYHRVNAISAARCRESDDHIKGNLSPGQATEYRCKNGLRDIGIPIVVAGEHLATLFMGQFFYDDEAPDRDFFVRQARELGFDEAGYLRALDRVPVFTRAAIENILAYNLALARFIADLAEGALRQKRAEAALRASEEQLRSVNRAKDDFLAMLSHELRNPLAPILNSIYILRHAAAGGEQARRAHDVIERQAEHLTRLVDDLLDVSRIARGKIELRRARVDLGEVLLRAGEDFRPILESRGIRFRTAIPDARVWMSADGTRLAQLVGNLLHNAAKFTRRGDEVTLSLAADEREAIIRVRDTGAGIDAALLPRMFEPFVQGERTLARAEGGLGLGLALVKRIAEKHGGSVGAESAGVGRGAEFLVRLPLADEPGSGAAGCGDGGRRGADVEAGDPE